MRDETDVRGFSGHDRAAAAAGAAARFSPTFPGSRDPQSRSSRPRYRWWARQDSNLQPDRYERPALTIELQAPQGKTPGEAIPEPTRLVTPDSLRRPVIPVHSRALGRTRSISAPGPLARQRLKGLGAEGRLPPTRAPPRPTAHSAGARSPECVRGCPGGVSEGLHQLAHGRL
jgi:hypothetical protein